MALPTRQFDVAVLGVTGFTGQFVLKELVSQICKNSKGPSTGLKYPVRVAAAGRSLSKVRRKLAELGIAEDSSAAGVQGNSASQGVPVTVGVAEVDVSSAASVAHFCRSTRLVLDCVGPFRFYGEPVVKGCVGAQTDYVDVTGEPEFMERMLLEYGDEAHENGALIVSGCGFDSIPAELGTQAALRALGTGDSPPGVAEASVESFLTIDAPLGGRGHYGTWDSLVNGLASADDLRKLRKAQREKFGARAKKPGGRAKKPGGKAKGSSPPMLPHWNSTAQAWVLPFPGADVSVVRRSLAHAKAQAQALAASTSAGADSSSDATKPLLQATGVAGPQVSTSLLPASHFGAVQYSAYFTVRSAIEGYLFIVFGIILTLMVRLEVTKRLLLDYPEFFSFGLFSRVGPTQQQMDATTTTMRFFAQRMDAGAGVRGSGSGRGACG